MDSLPENAKPQVEALLDQLDLIELTQTQLRALYPALAVLDPALLATAPNDFATNQALSQEIAAKFDEIRGGISSLETQLQDNPSLALQLDVVVAQTLTQMGVSQEQRDAGSSKSQAILDWVEEQQRNEALGAVFTLVLLALSLLTITAICDSMKYNNNNG